MSATLLAFLTRLEEHLRPALPEGRDWRFQRLLDFRAQQGTLQLWEGEALAGQAEARLARQEGGEPSFSGAVTGTGEAGASRAFSFRSTTAEEFERQARQAADLWRQVLPG